LATSPATERLSRLHRRSPNDGDGFTFYETEMHAKNYIYVLTLKVKYLTCQVNGKSTLHVNDFPHSVKCMASRRNLESSKFFSILTT